MVFRRENKQTRHSEAIINTDNTLHLNHAFWLEGLEALGTSGAWGTSRVGRVHGPALCPGTSEKTKAESLQANLLTSFFHKVIGISVIVNQSVSCLYSDVILLMHSV